MPPRKIEISWTNGTPALTQVSGNRATEAVTTNRRKRSKSRAGRGFQPFSSYPLLWARQLPQLPQSPQCRWSNNPLPPISSHLPTTLPMRVNNPSTNAMEGVGGAFRGAEAEIVAAETGAVKRRAANTVSNSNEQLQVGGRLRLFKDQW